MALGTFQIFVLAINVKSCMGIVVKAVDSLPAAFIVAGQTLVCGDFTLQNEVPESMEILMARKAVFFKSSELEVFHSKICRFTLLLMAFDTIQFGVLAPELVSSNVVSKFFDLP